MIPSSPPTVDWLNTPIEEIRAGREAFRAVLLAPLPLGLTMTEAPDGTLEFVPAGELEPVPILYFHGGGFVSGSPRTHLELCAWLAHLTRRRVVSARYPLAPEVRYPAQRDAAQAILARIAGPVILAGDSAGAALALWAEAGSSQAVRAVLCFYPALGLRDSASIRAMGTAASGLTPDVIAFFYDSLGASCDQMLADAVGSAPIIAVLATQDPFADDARLCAKVFGKRGRQVHVIEAEGMAHGFMHALALPDAGARDILARVVHQLNAITSAPPPAD